MMKRLEIFLSLLLLAYCGIKFIANPLLHYHDPYYTHSHSLIHLYSTYCFFFPNYLVLMQSSHNPFTLPPSRGNLHTTQPFNTNTTGNSAIQPNNADATIDIPAPIYESPAGGVNSNLLYNNSANTMQRITRPFHYPDESRSYDINNDKEASAGSSYTGLFDPETAKSFPSNTTKSDQVAYLQPNQAQQTKPKIAKKLTDPDKALEEEVHFPIQTRENTRACKILCWIFIIIFIGVIILMPFFFLSPKLSVDAVIINCSGACVGSVVPMIVNFHVKNIDVLPVSTSGPVSLYSPDNQLLGAGILERQKVSAIHSANIVAYVTLSQSALSDAMINTVFNQQQPYTIRLKADLSSKVGSINKAKSIDENYTILP
jgi:hypothetical protein